jgi:hypothetical protein
MFLSGRADAAEAGEYLDDGWVPEELPAAVSGPTDRRDGILAQMHLAW